MSSKHDLAHRSILQRLAALEAGNLPPTPSPPPAPTPSPPPSAGLLDSLDFTDSGALPSGVTVVRAGATATRRTGAQTVEIMAANTARYEYSSAGVLRGLLCEKARTNLVPNGRDISSFTTLGASPTIDDDYGGITDPAGGNEATRITILSGVANYQGKRLGVSGVSGARKMQVWARTIMGTQQLTYRNPDTNEPVAVSIGTTWQLIEAWGDISLTSDFYNFDLVNSNGANAFDAIVWGADLGLLGEDREDTIIATSGSSSTRPVEQITVTFSETSITGDIQITYDDGDKQNLLSQTINGSGEWTFDADDLDGRIIAQIDLYTEGELPEDPSAPPPSAPPPISTVEIQVAIDDMMQPTTITRSNGSTIGIYHGPYVTGYPAIKDSLTVLAPGQYAFHDAMDCLVPWIWCWEGTGNTASNTMTQLEDVNFWLLLDDYDGDWYHYIQNAAIGDVHVNTFQDAGNLPADYSFPGDGSVKIRPGTYLGNYTALEMWIDGPDGTLAGALDAALMKRVVAVYAEVTSRLVLRNPAGTDDRANARHWVCIGHDFYSRANQIAGNIGHPFAGSGGWPVHGYPGSYGRYKLVTVADQKHTMSPIKSINNVGWPPPWGSYQAGWPYQYNPWTMSEAQFRSNPPPPLIP